MGREIRLIRALADEGYQYGLNDGVPPIPRDQMVTFTQLPRHLGAHVHARRSRRAGSRSCSSRLGPDGTRTAIRDYDLLVPATVESLIGRAPRLERATRTARRRRVARRVRRGARLVDPPPLPRT